MMTKHGFVRIHFLKGTKEQCAIVNYGHNFTEILGVRV